MMQINKNKLHYVATQCNYMYPENRQKKGLPKELHLSDKYICLPTPRMKNQSSTPSPSPFVTWCMNLKILLKRIGKSRNERNIAY
jgi:hypothetical protein